MYKKYIFLAIFILIISFGQVTRASQLSQAQIDAIVALLQTFGVPQNTINDVSRLLKGETINNSNSTSSNRSGNNNNNSNNSNSSSSNTSATNARNNYSNTYLRDDIFAGNDFNNPCFNLSQSLYVGSTGNDVVELQKYLKKLGYYNYPEITGYFGPITKSALQKFQEQIGISPFDAEYGIVGYKTMNYLNRACDSSPGTGVVQFLPVNLVTTETPSGANDSAAEEHADNSSQSIDSTPQVNSSTAVEYPHSSSNQNYHNNFNNFFSFTVADPDSPTLVDSNNTNEVGNSNAISTWGNTEFNIAPPPDTSHDLSGGALKSNNNSQETNSVNTSTKQVEKKKTPKINVFYYEQNPFDGYDLVWFTENVDSCVLGGKKLYAYDNRDSEHMNEETVPVNGRKTVYPFSLAPGANNGNALIDMYSVPAGDGAQYSDSQSLYSNSFTKAVYYLNCRNKDGKTVWKSIEIVNPYYNPSGIWGWGPISGN